MKGKLLAWWVAAVHIPQAATHGLVSFRHIDQSCRGFMKLRSRLSSEENLSRPLGLNPAPHLNFNNSLV